jgi:hypothetical protein
MVTKRRRLGAIMMCLCGSLPALMTGCQAYVAGMTLPSPRYLEQRPQYFIPEPDFPLPKEQAYQLEVAEMSAMPGRANGNGVAPVPPGGLPGGR